MIAPIVSQDPMYQLLRHERFDEFNARRKSGTQCDLRNCDLRGLDLRKVHVEGLNLSNAYLRACDLRGLDLSSCDLNGAVISEAQISDCLFPDSIPAVEILLAMQHGTRIRNR